MSHKVGEKFIIEIDSVMTNKKGTLYGISGFNSLVFDDYGLEKLEKYPEKPIADAFKTGEHIGREKKRDEFEQILNSYRMRQIIEFQKLKESI